MRQQDQQEHANKERVEINVESPGKRSQADGIHLPTDGEDLPIMRRRMYRYPPTPKSAEQSRSMSQLRQEAIEELKIFEKLMRADFGDTQYGSEQEAPYVHVTPRWVQLAAAEMGASITIDKAQGLILDGSLSIMAKPHQIRLGLDKILNPMLDTGIPSTIITPIPVLIWNVKPPLDIKGKELEAATDASHNEEAMDEYFAAVDDPDRGGGVNLEDLLGPGQQGADEEPLEEPVEPDAQAFARGRAVVDESAITKIVDSVFQQIKEILWESPDLRMVVIEKGPPPVVRALKVSDMVTKDPIIEAANEIYVAGIATLESQSVKTTPTGATLKKAINNALAAAAARHIRKESGVLGTHVVQIKKFITLGSATGVDRDGDKAYGTIVMVSKEDITYDPSAEHIPEPEEEPPPAPEPGIYAVQTSSAQYISSAPNRVKALADAQTVGTVKSARLVGRFPFSPSNLEQGDQL